MKKSVVFGLIWSAWLGGWLGFLGYGIFTWQFWVIFIPVVIFTNMETDAKINGE